MAIDSIVNGKDKSLSNVKVSVNCVHFFIKSYQQVVRRQMSFSHSLNRTRKMAYPRKATMQKMCRICRARQVEVNCPETRRSSFAESTSGNFPSRIPSIDWLIGVDWLMDWLIDWSMVLLRFVDDFTYFSAPLVRCSSTKIPSRSSGRAGSTVSTERKWKNWSCSILWVLKFNLIYISH